MKFAQWDVEAWLVGTQNLSLEQRGVYVTLITKLYDLDGALPDDDRMCAHICNCSTRKFRTIKKELIEMGKIYVEDGYYKNDKTTKTLRKAAEKSLNAREKAEKRWALERAKTLKNNETADAEACSQNMRTRELDNQIKDIGAPPPPDFSEIKGWILEGNENPGALYRAPLASFSPEDLFNGFEVVGRGDPPPLGKRVAYLVTACRQAAALGHTGTPEGKEEFTKLKAERGARELAKTAGWPYANEVLEAWKRREDWAFEKLFPKGESA